MILPVYRPDHTLTELTEQLWEYGIQPLVVDDGSEPEYRHFFEEISDISVVLRHRENLGKGAAIKTALRYIQRELWNTDVIGVMDADGQHRTEDMVRLLRLALYLIVIWLAFSGGRERNKKYRGKDHPGRTSKNR